MESHENAQLVSVIIPCYNHGNYLLNAIESVWAQKYEHVEIIVVDDGSTDNTQSVLSNIPNAINIYQENQGLSAARNAGIKRSSGKFLIFLDADDWLLEYAVTTNLSYLVSDTKLAFVSGAHVKMFIESNLQETFAQEVHGAHFWHLLQGNYIGMHGAVMYRSWVFEHFLFDETLKACEDYDLYLKITRKFPVFHHNKSIAAYRIHGKNMSANIPLMLSSVLEVLHRQKASLQSLEEKQAYESGVITMTDFYCSIYCDNMASKKKLSDDADLRKNQEHETDKTAKISTPRKFKSNLKKTAAFIFNKLLKNEGLSKGILSDIKRSKPYLRPCSTDFGYDRGGPIDRYYIENFLKAENDYIKGRILEIGDNEYTLKYGGDKVEQSDILHVNESNEKATFIGDLSNASHIPDNIFDCIVLTQTLHLIYDFKNALKTCNRILKPGGALLLTAPGITPIDHGPWNDTWYWSFTDKSLSKIVAEEFPLGVIEARTFGNVYIASQFLYGKGLPEVTTKELDYHDPFFQVIITIKAIKGSKS